MSLVADARRRDKASFLRRLPPEALERINTALDRLDAAERATTARRARVTWDSKRRMPVIRPAKD